MADENVAIAETGLETAPPEPAIVETTVADEPERILDPGEVSQEQEGAAPVEIETVEIEWDDGKKYSIPKALESGILKNKDYTTKTQETAALKKALETRQAEIEERFKASDEYVDAKANLKLLDRQLAEYAKLTQEDWDAHQANDPNATEMAWRRYQMLKDQRTEAAKGLEKLEADRTGVAQQDLAKRIQETVEHAKKAIPGWTPNTIPQLVEFAQSAGIPEDAIKANWSPTFIDLLHKAHLGDQLLKKQATAPKLPNAQPKPLETVNGNKSAVTSTDLANMDMDAYVAARKKGVGGKALR